MKDSAASNTFLWIHNVDRYFAYIL